MRSYSNRSKRGGVNNKLPVLKVREFVSIIKRKGFSKINQSGSHATYRHPDGRWGTVSLHMGKDIPKGTLRSLIRQMGLSIDDLK